MINTLHSLPVLLIVGLCLAQPHARANPAPCYRVNASTDTTITAFALAGRVTWTNPSPTGIYFIESAPTVTASATSWQVVAYGKITSGTCTARFLTPESPASPYGVCAHISRHQEHPTAKAECAAMHEAGVGWVRTDFDWSYVQPQSNQWEFAQLDDTVREARMAGIILLPILGCPSAWASPTREHLPQWRAYVRAVAER